MTAGQDACQWGGRPVAGAANMRVTPKSEADAVKAARRSLLKPGWHDARITEAIEKLSKAEKDMIELTIMVREADGNERTLRDWLTASDRGAAKLRHAAEAVGALAQWEATGEIGQADFPGHDVQVKIIVQKRRGWPDSNQVEDYRAAAASGVVNLRQAG
jgi:hypothetical protein